MINSEVFNILKVFLLLALVFTKIANYVKILRQHLHVLTVEALLFVVLLLRLVELTMIHLKLIVDAFVCGAIIKTVKPHTEESTLRDYCLDHKLVVGLVTAN